MTVNASSFPAPSAATIAAAVAAAVPTDSSISSTVTSAISSAQTNDGSKWFFVADTSTRKITLSPTIASRILFTCQSDRSFSIIAYSSSNTSVGSISTVAGTASLALSAAASYLLVTMSTGTNGVLIVKDISNLNGTAAAGTLDTITSSSTYNGTGIAYGIVIGGGGAGGTGGGNQFGNSNQYGEGSGGGAGGGTVFGPVAINTATSVTVGAGGNVNGTSTSFVNNNATDRANSGGTTSFGAYSANGGQGGMAGNNGTGRGIGDRSAGGTGTVTGGFGAGSFNSRGDTNAGLTSSGSNIISPSPTWGGGGYSSGGGASGNVGIGGAPNSNNDGTNPTNASGYGAGGGGGRNVSNSLNQVGQTGRQGVVYIYRF